LETRSVDDLDFPLDIFESQDDLNKSEPINEFKYQYVGNGTMKGNIYETVNSGIAAGQVTSHISMVPYDYCDAVGRGSWI